MIEVTQTTDEGLLTTNLNTLTAPAEVPSTNTTAPLPVVDFAKFPKIPRFEKVQIVATEKIDGTNAQIVIPPSDSEPILVGSRNRWITPGKNTDNFGFAAWAYANEEALRRLGPGTHYGEWYGQGIGRGYGLTVRRWALFDIYRPFPEGLPDNVEKVPLLLHVQLDKLLLGAVVEPSSLFTACEALKQRGSRAVCGFMKPEGVVITIDHTKYKYVFDKTSPSPEEG